MHEDEPQSRQTLRLSRKAPPRRHQSEGENMSKKKILIISAICFGLSYLMAKVSERAADFSVDKGYSFVIAAVLEIVGIVWPLLIVIREAP
jgi:hypothetical protein